MNKTNRVAAALACVLAITSAAAVAATTDISGAWIVTIELPNNKATVEAHITQQDDKLVAQVISPMGGLNFNGTLIDNKISAVYTLQVQGNVLEIKMNGLVEGDTLTGTIQFAAGQEVKWTAARKPVVVAPAETVEPPAASPAPEAAPDAIPEASK